MRILLLCIGMLTVSALLAQQPTCLEGTGQRFSGTVLENSEESLQLQMDKTKGLKKDQQVKIFQNKSLKLGGGDFSWGKEIAQGKIEMIEKSGKITIGSLNRGNQDFVLFLLDHLLDVKIDEHLEIELQHERLCFDTLHGSRGYNIGCYCDGFKGEWNFFTPEGQLWKIENYNQKGELDGLAREYFPNGNVYEEGYFVEDTKVGHWIENFENGSVHRSLNFNESGRLVGEQIEFYASGIAYVKAMIAEGYDSLAWMEMRDSSGVIVRHCSFDSDFRLQGPYLMYAPNGDLVRSIDFQKDHIVNTWYRSGVEVSRMESYAPSKKPVFWYFQDEYEMPQFVGVPEMNGDKDGEWQEYDESGQLIWEGNYRTNERHGIWKFYQNQNIERIENYESGLPSGEWRSFFPDGGLAQKSNYTAGKPHGEWEEYFSGGQLKMRKNYVYGSLTGDFVAYSESGKLLEQGKYGDYATAGLRVGDWLEFYPDGRPKSKGEYLEGQKTGVWIYWDENGKKHKEKYK